jgi:hypothetical protein
MQQAAPASGQPQPEVCSISVPNSAVGALIGSGGVNIKQIIRESGAFVAVSWLILLVVWVTLISVLLKAVIMMILLTVVLQRMIHVDTH